VQSLTTPVAKRRRQQADGCDAASSARPQPITRPASTPFATGSQARGRIEVGDNDDANHDRDQNKA